MRAAAARGIFFEVSYSCALREPGARRLFLSNATALARATGGDALLLSSGALLALELRRPDDVANLGSLCVLADSAAADMLTKSSNSEPAGLD